MLSIPRSMTLPAVALLALAPAASASTIVRAGLEDLTKNNDVIVSGQIRALHSYWNADSTYIVTEFRLRPSGILKGDVSASDVTFTLFGGTVDSVSTFVVGGPEIRTGRDYVLFLDHGRLPGTREVLTTPDQIQAVFDVIEAPEGRVAVSQANSHGLIPDEKGRSAPPGGASGLPLEELEERVRRFARALD